MNNIKRLEMELAASRARNTAYEAAITELRSHMESSKFAGPDAQVIATQDVHNWLAWAWGEANAAENTTLEAMSACGFCGHHETCHESYKEYGQTKHYCSYYQSGACECKGFIHPAQEVAA